MKRLLWILITALLLAGCGASKVARVHSPRQVQRDFTAHGLALYSPGWTFPTKPVYVSALTADAAAEPFDTNPHHLQLLVSVWWSDAAAAKYARPQIPIETQSALGQLFAPEPNDRTLRVDNVVAEYHVSRYTAKLVARLKDTMAALAKGPTVKPPCSKDFCTDSS